MKVKQTQIQNLIIYIGDVFGLTIGYFIMSHIRFYDEDILAWPTNSQAIYRWLIAVFMLTISYIVLEPNKDFFKRKNKREILGNLKINILTGTFMATMAYLIDDARDYSRFIYIATMCFSFCWMQISHMVYRWYVLKYRPYNAMTRKMIVVTTSDRVKEVIHNIIKEKIWDLWVTGIIVVDENMVGQQVENIPIVADRDIMFQYTVREVVDEVFILMPEEPDLQIQKLVQKFEEM